MKQPVRILLWVLCAALILASPFVFSSPNLLYEVQWTLQDESEEQGVEGHLWNLFFSVAQAEEDLEVETVEDGPLGEEIYTLPVDFSIAPAANPACFTENSYEDETIRVRMEEREENGVNWRIAHIQIASPTQLRTATADPGKPRNTRRTDYVSTMAKNSNAVVALNGDNYGDDPDKTTFEYRMGEKIRSIGNRYKDVLVIDENGDFHFVLADSSVSREDHTARTRQLAEEWHMVQAFTFGPALVIDGNVITVNKDYSYNPNGKEPRSAIGQTGNLSYVLVIAEGRGESAGVTHQELADFMGSLGCVQAYNIDGGNSAEMVFGETYYKGAVGAPQRALNDIIYFTTAVPVTNWQ